MKALSLKIANIYLLSILFVPRYIFAAIHEPQRRQIYSPSNLLITPASTTTLTIANRAGSDTVALDPTTESFIIFSTQISTAFEAPAGPTFSSVVPIFTPTPSTLAAPNGRTASIVSHTSVEAPAGPTFSSIVPISNVPLSTLAAPNGPTASSVSPVTLTSLVFTAPTTHSTKSGDDHSISTTGSTIIQSVNPTMVSTTSFTIQSLTPAATSTASAKATSGVRSVRSEHTWSAILFLPWLAAVLSI